MKHTFIIRSPEIKRNAMECISMMPLEPLHEVIVREHKSKRSLDQNAKMWAMLTDISRQVEWHGLHLSKEEWKEMITAALKRQKVVPGIEGGFVVIGASTSKMSIKEMVDVIEFAYAFGAERNVKWTAPEEWER